MFAFGYALVPLYRAICEMTGINILALVERNVPGNSTAVLANTQVGHQPDHHRRVRRQCRAAPGCSSRPMRSMQVHPGEMVTVMYEFQNVQDRRMAAQAIPSYAPKQAAAHFNKLECFCFSQYTLEPGEPSPGRWCS
jgi:cytochrome c oxidase assembly protein subunit 11